MKDSIFLLIFLQEMAEPTFEIIQEIFTFTGTAS